MRKVRVDHHLCKFLKMNECNHTFSWQILHLVVFAKKTFFQLHKLAMQFLRFIFFFFYLNMRLQMPRERWITICLVSRFHVYFSKMWGQLPFKGSISRSITLFCSFHYWLLPLKFFCFDILLSLTQRVIMAAHQWFIPYVSTETKWAWYYKMLNNVSLVLIYN